MSLWNLYDTQSPVDAVSLDHTVTVRFAHPLADPELPREMSKTAPIVTGGDSQENHGENRGEGNGESYKGFREMSPVKSGSATSSPSHSHSQTATSQSFHTMMQQSFSRDDPSPLRTKRADGDGESPERSRLSPERSVPSPDSSVSREIAASRNLPTPDRNTLRGNHTKTPNHHRNPRADDAGAADLHPPRALRPEGRHGPAVLRTGTNHPGAARRNRKTAETIESGRIRLFVATYSVPRE